MSRSFCSIGHGLRPSLLLLTLSSLLFTGLTYAAGHDYAAVPLSEVVTLALRNHPQIRAEKEELEAAQQDLGSARWARFPTFGVDGRHTENSSKTSSLRVEQPLWSGGRISGQIALAHAGVSLRQSHVEAAQLSITEEVMKTYFDVLRLERKRRVAMDNEDEHILLVQTMRNRVSAAVSPQADLILVESRLSQAVTTRLQVQRELHVARDRLNELTGSHLGSLQLVAPEDFDNQLRLSEWQQLVMQYSPERRNVIAEIDQSRSQRKLARAQSLPTVVLGHEERLADLDYSGQERGVNYIAVNMQLGAGLSSVSAVRAAARREQAARQRLLAREIQVRNQVQNVWAEIEALQNQLPSVIDSTRGASQIVESYLRQFQVGKKSWLDVLNVQREKAQAFYSLADTELGLTSAKFRLLAMAGMYQNVEGKGNE